MPFDWKTSTYLGPSIVYFTNVSLNFDCLHCIFLFMFYLFKALSSPSTQGEDHHSLPPLRSLPTPAAFLVYPLLYSTLLLVHHPFLSLGLSVDFKCFHKRYKTYLSTCGFVLLRMHSHYRVLLSWRCPFFSFYFIYLTTQKPIESNQIKSNQIKSKSSSSSSSLSLSFFLSRREEEGGGGGGGGGGERQIRERRRRKDGTT